MGMTIEEHQEHLLDIMDSMPDDACGDWRDSLAYAIYTMRKYQKIEQILHNGFGKGVYAVFDEIVKVVEDGKDD